MFEECFGNGPFVFRLNENGCGPQLLTQVCLERGWREYNCENDNWNLWWRTSGFPVSHHRSLYAWQYLNHIPKGAAICRKDNLVRYLRCMRKVYGSIYDFSPHGYNLPLEFTKLAAECSRGRPTSGKEDVNKYFEEKPIWICKPVAQSQGRGIFLFRDIGYRGTYLPAAGGCKLNEDLEVISNWGESSQGSIQFHKNPGIGVLQEDKCLRTGYKCEKLSELNYDTNTIVQRYIEKPLLIGGYKFDLRLYVCIPSYHPVTIYMYREGLARFGTDKFSLTDLRNPFRHLTNCSINKLGPGYAEMKDRVGSGCKWTLRQLRRYFQQAGISDWLLWQRITSLVILTVLSHVSQIPPTVNCFEFFGFDVLIDNSLRPWLLEVNLSPALSNDCDADRLVKKPMLHDMFDLLGLPLYNTGLAVYSIFSDEANDEAREDIENAKLSLMNTISVVNAAGRWRRKQKKMSALHPRSGYAIRTRSRSTSANIQKTYMTLPRVQIDVHGLGSPTHTKPTTKPVYDDHKKTNLKSWGNGRDWNLPKPREGGWVRIWPLAVEVSEKPTNNINNGHVKGMVNKVMKFTKTAKDLAKKHPTASECQLSEFLQEETKMTGDVWIPPV